MGVIGVGFTVTASIAFATRELVGEAIGRFSMVLKLDLAANKSILLRRESNTPSQQRF